MEANEEDNSASRFKHCVEMLIDMSQFLHADLVARFKNFLSGIDYSAPELGVHVDAMVKIIWGDYVRDRPEHDTLNTIVLKHFPDARLKNWDDIEIYRKQAHQVMHFLGLFDIPA